jgi:hypothetical protein
LWYWKRGVFQAFVYRNVKRRFGGGGGGSGAAGKEGFGRLFISSELHNHEQSFGRRSDYISCLLMQQNLPNGFVFVDGETKSRRGGKISRECKRCELCIWAV